MTARLSCSLILVLIGYLGAFPVCAQNFPLASGSYVASVPAEAIGLSIADSGAIVIAINRNVGDGNPGNNESDIELRRPDTLATLDVFPQAAALRSLRSSPGSGPRWVATTDDSIVIGSSDGAQVQATWPIDQLAVSPRQAQACGERVAVLAGNQASLFDLSGTLLGQFSVSATNVADIACTNAPERLIVTGYRQASANLQVAFVEAYDPSGTILWRSWGWIASEAQNAGLTSDTRGLVVQMAANGELYFGASSAGGAAVFNRDPQDLGVAANNVSFDSFNQTSNLGGPSIVYYAHLDTSTGALDRGQYLLTRLSSGSGNTATVQSMAIDPLGRLHLGGQANASMANRTTLEIAGLPVAAYAGADPQLLVAAADFSARVHWTTFIAAGGRGRVTSVAALGDRYALLIQSQQGGILTPNGILSAADLSFPPGPDQPAAWLGVWGNSSFELQTLFADGFE